MTPVAGFYALIALTGIERLVELVVGKRNLAWSLSKGGVEFGQGHWPWMVTLHTGFLGACVLEVYFLETQFHPIIGGIAFLTALGCQGLRWWCIRTLGHHWNPRVVVVPGAPKVTGGPYRWFPHPNYVAVVLEGIALPMVHGAWRTALAFTVLNAWLLSIRIACENEALDTHLDTQHDQ